MTIEVLFSEGCPGFAELLPRLSELADSVGAALLVREVETLEAAELERFLGSPTVRVDGRDVDRTAEARTDFGLKCRLYRHGDDLMGSPPEAWLRAALNLQDQSL